MTDVLICDLWFVLVKIQILSAVIISYQLKFFSVHDLWNGLIDAYLYEKMSATM